MRIAGLVPPASLLLFLAACAATDKSQEEAAEPAMLDAPQSGGAGEAAPDGTSTAGDPAAPAGDQLSQDIEKLALEEQAKRLLIDDRLDKAEMLMSDGRFDDAMREVEMALEMNEDDARARELYAQIGTLLGRSDAQRQATGSAVVEAFQVRVEQIKSEAEDYLNRGKIAIGRRDYDSAINELSLAQTLIDTVPYSIDWSGMDAEVDALLERSYADRKASDEARLKAQQQQAFEDLAQRQRSEEERQRALTAGMVSEAILAFDEARYDAAIEYADRALERDPRNEQAEEIRQAAFRAGRSKVREDYIAEKREEFTRWREHLEELRVPWGDVMTLPDREQWRRNTEIRSSRKGYDIDQEVSAAEVQLREKLATTPVRLPGIEEEESLTAVIDIVRNYTGLPLVVDPAAENLVYDEGNTFDLDLPNEISVQQALNLISQQAGEDVTWTIRHDAVLLTTNERARGKPIVINHSVQDLIMGLTDFMGPRIERLRLLDELEDDDGGGPFGGILESPMLIDIDELSDIVTRNVAPLTWGEGDAQIDTVDTGFLLVTHSPEVQQQVREFLDDLRRFNSSLVTIESKFLTVGNNWIQLIGTDWRGLDSANVDDVTNGLEDMASRGLDNGGSGSQGEGAAGPPAAGFFFDDEGDGAFAGAVSNFFGSALGNSIDAVGGMAFQLTFLNDADVSLILRAVEKETEYEVVNSQMLSVHNTQRAYVTVINQQAYIQDFDVEVAQFQSVADPQINVLHEGVVLDVRPTILHDRKHLTLEVQPTIAKVVNLRTFSTTLGGNTSPVDFQLPELEVQSVNTSAIIPDGGSILLGGLSSVRNVERRAEVPWIARVPILGFLFKEEGYNDERESLMILIKATILDIQSTVEEKLERRY